MGRALLEMDPHTEAHAKPSGERDRGWPPALHSLVGRLLLFMASW